MNWACIAPQAEVLAACPEPAAWFTPEEQARWAAFSGERRRQQFLAGRWLARLLLAQLRGGTPAGQRLTQDSEGRCLAPAPWMLSISHSGEWVGAAVGQGAPVGLDLQLESSRRDWSALAAFAGLQDCPDAATFYRHWTLAEAWLKAHADISSLSALRGLRWHSDARGPAWQGRIGDLHWAFVGTTAPLWLSDLLPQGLQPTDARCWSPLSEA